ncbi:MAG: WxcM-like domain-containing protein [bacterium]
MPNNTLDYFSKPISKEPTKLAMIFTLNPRDSKKGRLFIPIFDQRFPLVFDVKYAYISKFLELNNISGNHYHLIKQEILIPLNGKYEITLEQVETKVQETILMNSDNNQAIYIPVKISHKVKSLESSGVMLVLASNPSSEQDEIEYNL